MHGDTWQGVALFEREKQYAQAIHYLKICLPRCASIGLWEIAASIKQTMPASFYLLREDKMGCLNGSGLLHQPDEVPEWEWVTPSVPPSSREQAPLSIASI